MLQVVIIAIWATSGSAGTSRIMFGDKDDEDIGKIEYDNSNNDLTFFTDTTERFRISSDGAIKKAKWSRRNRWNYAPFFK